MEKHGDILKELQEIAPKLASLPKRNFHSAPENYFLHFKSDLLKKVKSAEAEAELQSVAPSLLAIEKQHTAEVPAGYFDTFPQQMFSKVSSPKAKATSSALPFTWLDKLFSLLSPKYAFALSGTVAVAVIALMMVMKVEQCDDLECKMASLTDEEINNYLDDDTYTYSDEIFESTSEESLSPKKINHAYNEVLRDISNEELDRAILN